MYFTFDPTALPRKQKCSRYYLQRLLSPDEHSVIVSVTVAFCVM